MPTITPTDDFFFTIKLTNRHCDSQASHMTPVLLHEFPRSMLQHILKVKHLYCKHPATDRTNEQ